MAASRITFRMAADGVLPRVLAVVAPGGTPRRSVAVVAIASVLFAASGSYETIVRIYAPWSIGSVLMICLSGVWLRYREPGLDRPFRTPWFPWLSIFAALIQASLIAVVVIDDPASGFWSAVVVAVPLPVYLFFARRRRSYAKGPS
jgi:amino acid transporter